MSAISVIPLATNVLIFQANVANAMQVKFFTLIPQIMFKNA